MDTIAIHGYLQEIQLAVANALFQDDMGRILNPEMAYQALISNFRSLCQPNIQYPRNKIIFIGNGGSAAIASHMAEDYSKMGNIRAICFNDGPLITCLANDYSFPEVFGKALIMYADPGDSVVAISSSGKSPNIVYAAETARKIGCTLITLSGFDSKNSLARLGFMNIFTPVEYPKYGIVENAHQIILHFILDMICVSSPK